MSVVSTPGSMGPRGQSSTLSLSNRRSLAGDAASRQKFTQSGPQTPYSADGLSAYSTPVDVDELDARLQHVLHQDHVDVAHKCGPQPHIHSLETKHSSCSTHTHSHNPLGVADFTEVCACCQQLDVDEAVLAAKALGAQHTHEHGWQARLPKGQPAYLQAAFVAYTCAPGIYFGLQNFRQCGQTINTLNAGLAYVAERQKELQRSNQALQDHVDTPIAGQVENLSVPQPKSYSCAEKVGGGHHVAASTARGVKDSFLRHKEREHNLAAYRRTIFLSRSMQKFTRFFGGLVPLCGSVLMLGSIFMPALGPIGNIILVAYCISHVVRYLGWEVWDAKGRVSAEPNPSTLNDVAQRGQQIYKAWLLHRAHVFMATSLAFVSYAASAAAIMVAELMALPALMPAALIAFCTSLLAVFFLNNGPVKDSFGKNADKTSREDWGDDEDLLTNLGKNRAQHAVLQALNEDFYAQPLSINQKLTQLWGRCSDQVLWLLSMVLTFGLTSSWLDGRRHRLRSEEIMARPKLRDSFATLAKKLETIDLNHRPSDLRKSWTGGGRAYNLLRLARAAELQSCLVPQSHGSEMPPGWKKQLGGGTKPDRWILPNPFTMDDLLRREDPYGPVHKEVERMERELLYHLLHVRPTELDFKRGAIAAHRHARRRLLAGA